ncbi:hypothetical protein GCM10027174_45070 [Salinifilum aidingensis]
MADHDHTDRRAEIHAIARELAQHHGRFAEPITDVTQWLHTHAHRQTGALLVVWDRADAAVLEREHPDAEVFQAAPRIRYRESGADPPDDLPRSRPPSG